MTVTLRDVAELAGVSVSTASRALTGDRTRPVATETEARILEAVRQLDYRPRNPMGPELTVAGPHTHSVGAILRRGSYKFSDPFWAPVLDGVDAELAKHGYNLAFTLTVDELEHEHRQSLLSRNPVDGILLFGAVPPVPEWIDPKRLVIVEGADTLRWNPELDVDIVAIEKRRAIYAVVEHLANLKRTRIAFLGPPAEREERAEAFPHALERVQQAFDPTLMIESPWTVDGAQEAASVLLERADRPDAIVCASDEIAMGAMQTARRLALRLPQDLAVTGFDDTPFAAGLTPPLTTIRVPNNLLGVVAARRMIDRINDPDLPTVIQMVRTSLVVRASCGEGLEDSVRNE